MAYGIKAQLDMNSLRQCRTEFEKHLKSMQELANRNIITTRVGNMNSQLNQTTQGLQGMNTQARSFTDNVGYAIKRVAQFAIGMSAVYGAVKLIKEGIQEIATIDTSNVNIAMITGESVENVQKMNTSWLETAKALQVVNSEVVSSQEEWLRAGVSIEEANKNTETNIKLARVSNLSNKEVADSLIVLKNAYELTTDGVEKTSNKIALLDTKSATSSAKIMQAMSYTAQTAKESGLSEDFLLGSLTAVLERSKQGGEAIGRATKSILLNFRKLQDGEDIEGLSKLEDILGKQNIAIRTSEKEWRNTELVMKDLQKSWGGLDDITKTQIATLTAGKNQAEQFNIIMGESKRIAELENKVKQDSNSLNEAYAKHLDSIEGKMANLKNAGTEFWTSLISSSAIKTAIDGLTEAVQLIKFLTVENRNLGLSILAIGIAVKNFTAFKYVIGECIAFMSLLRTEGIATLAVLEFNPVILALTALALAVGVVVYAQYKHSKEVKQLQEDYVNLKKSMEDLNGDEIQKNTEKLKEQQKTLDELSKKASESYDFDLGFGVTTNDDQDALDKFIEKLEEGGFHVNNLKTKIIELQGAEQDLKVTDSIKAIQDKTSATILEADETEGLIGQYQALANQENLSAEKKKMLSNITQQLVGRIDGLTIATDEQGNSSITNSKHLSGQIDILDLLKQQAIITGNTQMEMAINTAQTIHGSTMMTIEDMKSAIIGQQILSKALASTSAGKSGFFDTEQTAIGMGIKNLEDSVAKIDALKSKFKMDAPTISSGNGYTPPKKEEKEKKSKADAKDIENIEAKTDRYYKLESALQSVEMELDRLNKLESSANEEEKLKLKEKEIKLLDDKKISLQNIYREQEKENQLNADLLKRQGAKFDSQGNIVNRNELLTSKTNASNKLTGDAKRDSQEAVKQFEEDIKSYEDLRFSKITDISSKIFTLEQDRIAKLKDLEIEKLDQKLKSIDKTYGAESQEIEDVKYRLEEIGASEEDSKETIQEKVKLTKDLVKATGDYNVKLLTGYGESLTLLNSTKEGTIEWDKANSKVEEFKDKLKSTNIEMLNLNKSNRDLVENQMQSLIETQKKIQELQMEQRHKNEQTSLASSIYGVSGDNADAVKAAYDNQNKIAQDAIQAQIDGLNAVNDIQTEIETRVANQNSLIEKQTALQNAQNNENVQTMIKNSDGSFQFKYVADVGAVETAQKAVDDQIISNNAWEKSTALKHQTDSLNALKKSLADQKTAKDNDYAEKLATLQVAQTNETNTMALHYTDMNLLVKTSLDTMVADYKGDWKLIIDQLTTDVGTATSLYAQLAAMQAGVGSINGYVGGGTGTTSTGGYTTTVTDSNGYKKTQTQSSSEYYSSANQSNLNGLSSIPGVTVSTQKFARGGESSKTGMHWLDGEIGRPERVLSSTQTKDFGRLVQDLPRTLSSMESMKLTPTIKYDMPMTYMPKGLTSMEGIMDKINFSSVNSNTKQGDTNHNYHINDVSFPNANSTDDIIRAFEILPNIIHQKTSGPHDIY
jgi:TP901 family phage tail tape measure protein